MKLKSIIVKGVTVEMHVVKKGYNIKFIPNCDVQFPNKKNVDELFFFDDLTAEGVWVDILIELTEDKAKVA